MQRSCPWHIKVRLIWAVAVMGLSVAAGHVEADADKDFEVWAIDQSDSPGATFGGTLYIYHGQDLIKASGTAVPEVIDLGGAVSALCLAETGANPVRPHIVLFNSTHTHAILAFVASGHVVFIEAATRTPIKCLRMSLGFNNNRQAHAAFPSPDDRYVMVANQTGKLLERIDTDADNDGTPYEDADDIVHDPDATLNLATCTTPSGAPCEQADVRPNNTVICPIIDRTSTLTFITLAGGGLLVADTSADSAAPPIVAEYDTTTIKPNGCGGMQSSLQSANNRIYLNAGAGAGNPSAAHLFSLPADVTQYPPSPYAINTPAPTTIFSTTAPNHDSHGMLLNRKRRGRFLWANDRAANAVEVVDTTHDTHVKTFGLLSEHSADPAPDLMDISPRGTHAFITLRGPCPLTANIAGVNNAVGATPGVGVVTVMKGGFTGKLVGVAPIHNVDPTITNCAPSGAPGSNDRADPHGIAVRLLDEDEEEEEG